MDDDIHPFVEQIQKKAKENLESKSFEECETLKRIGQFLSANTFDAEDDVIKAVQNEADLSQDEAKQYIREYLSLFEAPKEELPGFSERAMRYFIGESVSEIADDTSYSEGEIRRQIRKYVAESIEVVDQSEVNIQTTYPDPEALRDDYEQMVQEVMDDAGLSDIFEKIDDIDIDRPRYPFEWANFLPVDTFRQLREVYDDYGTEAVREVLADAIEEKDVQQHIESSRYYEGERKALFLNALNAYREGKYSLSIPLSLTQIDGLVIKLGVELGIWEMNNDVTGTAVIQKTRSEQSDKHFEYVDDFFKDYYPRLMGRGSPRAKILHGIRTDYRNDREFAAELLWVWLKVFQLTDKVFDKLRIREESLLEFLAVSEPKSSDEIAERFDSHPMFAEEYCERRCGEHLTHVDEGYTITEEGIERLNELNPHFVE